MHPFIFGTYKEDAYITGASKSGQLCCHNFFINLPILPFDEKILLLWSTSISKSEPFDQLVWTVSICPSLP
jgi:hypothetical protein